MARIKTRMNIPISMYEKREKMRSIKKYAIASLVALPLVFLTAKAIEKRKIAKFELAPQIEVTIPQGVSVETCLNAEGLKGNREIQKGIENFLYDNGSLTYRGDPSIYPIVSDKDKIIAGKNYVFRDYNRNGKIDGIEK